MNVIDGASGSSTVIAFQYFKHICTRWFLVVVGEHGAEMVK